MTTIEQQIANIAGYPVEFVRVVKIVGNIVFTLINGAEYSFSMYKNGTINARSQRRG